MSFVMIATGSASGGSPVRTLSVGPLLIGALIAALALLTAGAALGWWIATARPATDGANHAAATASPFALEQLGALSGRLFKLESQASQLRERIDARPPSAPPAATPHAANPGSGGPMLPPRAGLDARDTVNELEARFARLELQLGMVSEASARQAAELMRLPSRRPIEGAELTSVFGNREDPFTGRRAFHAGLDFGAETGTPIHAAAGGTIAFAGFRSDFGWVVDIDHGNGLTTRYGHASRLLVKAGDLVAPGDVVAMVGSTGRSTGPHLHFEVLRGGEATDPRRYLAGL